jgi:NTE family protein
VIAVDATGRTGIHERRQPPAVARLGRLVRRILTGSEAEIPRLSETILRTMTVGSIDTVAAAPRHSDLVITPQVEQIGLMDWKALPRVVELGRRAAREALEANPELMSRLEN